MRRLAPFLTLLVLATVFVVACEDSQLPTMVDSESISLAISDGAHQGPGMLSNPDFFFLPPIVPNPSGDTLYEEGEFNPYLAPKAQVCISGAGGVCADTIGTFFLELNQDSTHYAYQWHTAESNLTWGIDYRINVFLGSAQIGELGYLGYRDVHPVETPQEVPSNPDTRETYIFRDGSTIPIKVRIENSVLCPGTRDCVTKWFDLEAADGVLELLDPDGSTGQLNVPQQDEGTTGSATLSMRSCDKPLSDRIDIPIYGPCIEIDDITDDGSDLILGSLNPAIITVCDILEEEWHLAQHDLVALHRWHSYEPSEPGEDEQLGSVEALPRAGTCYINGAAPPSGFFKYAKAGWGIVRDLLLPAPLNAKSPVVLHRGMGGSTPVFSRFQLALPAKMEIKSGNNQIALAGEPVPDPLVVSVTDLAGLPVEDATVRFELAGAPEGADPPGTLAPVPFVVTTGSNGLARVPQSVDSLWRLGSIGGDYFLDASGRGIAVEGVDGPRSYFDPFAPLQTLWGDGVNGDTVHLRDDGTVTFTATACEALYDVEALKNGSVGPADIVTQDYPFYASISGGSAFPATLHLWNDCVNLFVGLTVARDGDEKVNSLRIDLDGDDPSDGRTEGDDVVIVDVDGGNAALRDMWLTRSCVSKKQAGCGADDASADDKEAAFNVDLGVSWTYVVVIPLRNPDDPEHDLNVALGDDVGVSITLQMGNGAQGNTQYPGFASYRYFTINP